MPGEQVSAAYAKISLDAKELDSGMNAAHGRFSGFVDGLTGKASSGGKAIGTALAAGAVAAGVALAGVATIGVKSYMDIESSAADAASKMDLSEIAKKSGKSIEESFKGVKEHVIAVSRELGQLNTNAFDPTQIAKALAGLAAGGFDVATASAKNLTPILSLATATNYELDKSASMAMATMNQYGLSIDDLGKISDVFTQACGDSALGMEDLQYALSYAGPVAKAAGVSLEETVAALEVFSNSGIKGEKAGTALVDVMNTLVAPTGAASKALAGIGVNLKDVDPRTHDFADVLSTLKQKADASGDGLKAFTEIFGVRGGLIYGLAGATDQIEGFEAKLESSTGAAERMAKLMLDTLSGSFDAAMGAATDLAIGIGQDLAPTIKGLLDWFSSDGAPAIRELYNAFKEGDWGKIGTMMADAVKKGWEKIKDIGKDLYNRIKSVNWGGLGSYVAKGIKAAWNELSSLGGQLLGWLKNIDWGSIGMNLANSVSSAVVGLGAIIYNVFTDVDWSGIVELIKSEFNFLVGYYSTLGKNLYDAIVNVDWSGIGTKVLDSLKGIRSKISDIFSGTNFADIGKGITDSLENIGTKISGYINDIRWADLGYKAGVALKDAINNAIATLSDIGSKISGYISSVSWGATGTDIATKIKGGIDAIKNWADQIKTGFLAGWEDTGQKIGGLIKNGLAKVVDYAKSIYESIYKGLKDWVTNGRDLENVGGLIIDGIAAGIAGIVWVTSKIGKAIAWLFSWENFKKAFNFVALGTIAIGDIAVGMIKEAGIIGVKIGGAIAAGIADAMDAVNFEVMGININLGDYTEGLRSLEKYSKELKLTAEELSGINVVSVDIDTNWAEDENPAKMDGKTYQATVHTTYTSSEGTSLPAPKIGGQSGYDMGKTAWDASGKELTAMYNGVRLSTSQIAKAMELQGYTNKDIRDTLLGIQEDRNARKPSGQVDVNVINEAYFKKLDIAGDEDIKTAKKAADIGIAGAKEEAKIEKDGETTGADISKSGATDAAKTTTSAASTAAATTIQASEPVKAAALTFREQIWKAVSDTDQMFRSGGEAIKFGLTEQGQKIAIIGQIAQQQFQAASGKWVGDVALTGATLGAKISASGSDLQVKLQTGGTDLQTKLQMSANSVGSALQSGANAIGSAASKLMGFDAGALWKSTMGTLSGPGTSSGTTSSGTVSDLSLWGGTPKGWTGQTIASTPKVTTTAPKTVATTSTDSFFDDPWMQNIKNNVTPAIKTTTTTTTCASTNPDQLPCAANGMKTLGPQLAMIGEDGAANPEYVIPTKTKRWDLLLAAMRSYGIPGYAEGTSTGGTSSEGTDAPPMQATFGIIGLANMSKDVKKIISDLKDFFRISWGIIKAEGATYWKAINSVINAEVTATRNAAWQGALDIRNSWITANAAVLADATATWTAYWPSIEPTITSLKGSFVYAFEEIQRGSEYAISMMASNSTASLSQFQTAWQGIWQTMLADFANAQVTISQGVASIAAELQKISVNVAINASFGGGGRDYSSSSDGDWASGDVTNGGPGTNSVAYDPRSTACIPFNKPDASLKTTDPFYINMGAQDANRASTSSIGSTMGSFTGGPLPAIFRSAGGAIFNSPSTTKIAENGPEMVLPTPLTRMFLSLVDAGLGQGSGNGSRPIVIEDHTVHHWYMDSKEVTKQVMKGSVKQMKLRGATAIV